MIVLCQTFHTPLGEFSVGVNEAGTVVATAFGSRAVLARRVRLVRFVADKAATDEVRQQVLAYFSGERRVFELPLAPHGTAFQQQVWSALRTVGFGATRTYAEIARAVGCPRASRAVGRANATNPLCLIVPCHRVIGSDGSLTGFAFGERIKRALLEHERSQAVVPARA